MPRRMTAEQKRAHAADRAAADQQAALAESLIYCDATRDLFAEFARHRWSHVRRAIAANRTTPPEVLTWLVRDTWEPTRSSIALNPATPEQCLIDLARSKRSDHFLLLNVAANPSRTPEVLRALASRRTGITHRVAGDPLTPVDVLRRMARSSRVEVSAAALTNPSLPGGPDRLRTADESTLLAVLNMNRGIYWNDLSLTELPDPVLDVLDQRVQDASITSRVALALAHHAQTRPATLERLAAAYPEDPNMPVALARHRNTPPDVLRALALHDNPRVRRETVANPACPDDAAVAEALLR